MFASRDDLLVRLRRPGGVVVLILGLGVILRLAYFLAVSTVMTPSADSGRYLGSAFTSGGMFTDLFAPSGYPLFLKGIGWLPERGVSIAIVQHLLGLLTAYGVWVLGRRIASRAGVSEWWAVPGVAFAALAGDLLFFEHSIMTETLAIALLVGLALLAERTTRTDVDVRPLHWILLGLATGLVLALSYSERSIAGPVGVVLLGLGLLLRRGLRERLLVGAAIAVAALGGLFAYTTIAHDSKGGQTGFGGMDGWYLYARTSSFADCGKIHPKRDLRSLCDSTPPSQRNGLFAYVYRYDAFKVQTPAVRRFGWHPNGNDTLREFGMDAILAQPLDYVKTVAKELTRYIAPDAGVIRPYSGPGPEFLRIRTLSPTGISPAALEELDTDRIRVGPLATAMEIWGSMTRVPGALVVLLVLLPPLAMLRRRSRDLTVLLLPVWAAAVASAVAPVLLVSFEYRYGLPALVLLASIGPISVGVLAQRRRPAARLAGDARVRGPVEDAPDVTEGAPDSAKDAAGPAEPAAHPAKDAPAPVEDAPDPAKADHPDARGEG